MSHFILRYFTRHASTPSQERLFTEGPALRSSPMKCGHQKGWRAIYSNQHERDILPSLRLARACATVSIRAAEQARAQALNLLGVIEAGADPVAERRTERAVRTFHEVAEDFMAQHVLDKCKARTAESYRCLLDKYVLPELGEKGIIDIGGADVARLHSSLGEILRQECYLSREETEGTARHAASCSAPFLPEHRSGRFTGSVDRRETARPLATGHDQQIFASRR